MEQAWPTRQKRSVANPPTKSLFTILRLPVLWSQHKGCDLKLSQAQLVAIFQGKITNYNQLGCAAKPIKVVVRSDGSGTTANFTAHLAAIDASWKQQVGTSKSVK